MANLHQKDDRENFIEKKFPIEIFPKEIQDIIKMYSTILNINEDYAAASILFCFGSAIGSSYSLVVKRGWTETSTIFIALVGKPGINKSAPISIFTEPLEKIDKLFYEKFIDDYRDYKQQHNKIEGKKEKQYLEPPNRKQLIIKDATQEALLQALNINPHGLAGVYDELGSFLKSFNKYKPNGGSDEETLLSLFSSKSISINRKNSEPILITNPSFNLIGSIQPQVLVNLLGNNRIDNGLTHRFLFTFPDNVKREPLSDDEINSEVVEDYDLLIRTLLKHKDILAGNFTNKKIPLSKEAKLVHKQYRERINEIINNENRDAISGIYAKLETYFLRLSLIIHLMEITCGNREINLTEVSACSAQKAAKLIDYFEYMALKVFKLMEKLKDPLINYSYEQKTFYYQLPPKFTTNDAIALSTNSLKRRTLFIFLSDNYLFKKLKHGVYEKVW